MIILIILYSLIAICVSIVAANVYESMGNLEDASMLILICSVFWITVLPTVCVYVTIFPKGKQILKDYCELIEK